MTSRRYRSGTILIALVISILGLQPAAFGALPIACGKTWINLHQKNPDLIGISVQQLPDNKSDEAAYKGKHPAMIVYVFKDGKAHQVSYTPSGQIENGWWWDIPVNHFVYTRTSTDLRDDVTCAYWVRK